MIRRAFTMRLKPDSLAEYKRHHDNVWPELVAAIKRSGIAQITTFQRGLDLFLFSEIRDEGAWNRLWTSPIHRRWADLMQPLMHLTDDGLVDAGELTEIFHLETKPGKKAAKSSKKKATKPAAKKQTKSPKTKKKVAKRKAKSRK